MNANVLLLEPGYPNKYPPLGLMKIAAYHRDRGDRVQLAKGTAPPGSWDRVYVTTLFSFEWKRTAQAIDQAIASVSGRRERVFVGGISASLMPDEYHAVPDWNGIRIVQGILDRAPRVSLGLRAGDFDATDNGPPIDERIPDYSILKDLEGIYRYPVTDAYFGYASRGCVRKCAFCGVPKLEGAQREMPSIATVVSGIAARHGEKKDLVLMDNNITASSRFAEVMAEIRDLGFVHGARLVRGKGPGATRRLDFNQGVDARILIRSPMYLRELARTCIRPLRIAFDHTGMRKMYEQAVRMAVGEGIGELSNYLLYNFMDSPEDLYDRMRLNARLKEELGVRIWSFPMRYQPVDLKDRSHVGRRWTRYRLRSFQIMLQATRGVVSANPAFFRHAYGQSPEEFTALLDLPHAFIFNREHYASGPGRPVRESHEAARARLTPAMHAELVSILGHAGPGPGVPRQYYLERSRDPTIARAIRRTLSFHLIPTDTPTPAPVLETQDLAEDERVEDAGTQPDASPP